MQGYEKIIIFDQYVAFGNDAITMEGEYETAPKLSNGTSFNDLE